MHSEREINQTCAGFTDHCVNGATCDPDTNLCTTVKTEYSKCYLYAIPGVLSTPFLCLGPTLSVSLLHRCLSVCLHVLICSGILSAIATPPPSNYLFHYKQWCTADAEVKVPCAENPALPKMHSFNSDLATMEVGMF